MEIYNKKSGMFMSNFFTNKEQKQQSKQHLCPEDFYTDLHDVPNPSWEKLKSKLPIGQNSYGPAYGSTIKVKHKILLQNLPNTIRTHHNRNNRKPDNKNNIRIHTVTNSCICRKHFPNMTRWYMEDGNTQIFRMFPNEDNIRNNRTEAPRVEAYSTVKWKKGDGWYEFTAIYTFLKVRPGAVFQIKHNEKFWSMQLILEENVNEEKSTFDLYYVKLRDPNAKTLLARDVACKSYHVHVLDNGIYHKVYINGEIHVQGEMSNRNYDKNDINHARWGIYSPRSSMDRNILIFITNAHVGKVVHNNNTNNNTIITTKK